MEDKKSLPSEEYADNHFPNVGYEVVRSQFFSQSSEPAVTFGRQKMWVNGVCLTKFPEFDYVQILINRENKVLTLHPSQEGIRDSLRWCYSRNGKRKPRQLSCPVFWAKICALMEWDTSCRYRIAGKCLHSNGSRLLAFDLRVAEIYTYNTGTVRQRAPWFPADWRDWFGTPAEEHSVAPLVHIFDEYAVFELEPSSAKPDAPAKQALEGEGES